LCVIDKIPRELRSEQKQALRILARHVVSQFELRRRSRELSDIRRESTRLKPELEKARADLASSRRQPAPRKANPADGLRSKAKKKHSEPQPLYSTAKWSFCLFP
jgi:septal ring factor EnvC (AmiA/AmiB activator)